MMYTEKIANSLVATWGDGWLRLKKSIVKKRDFVAKRYLCAMKDRVDTLIRLGEDLLGFGANFLSREVMKRAQAANGWFGEAEICRSVEAIRVQMLSAERLREWLEGYPTLPVCKPRRVLVVMAGNIPLVGFFDLLCVVASGHHCLIKPATKDRLLMAYLVERLRAIDSEIPIEFYDGTAPVDAVIATGSDSAVRHFRAQYADIPTLLRGNRRSVAVLSGRETAAQWAELAADIWTYSGLGCRNVSLLFMPEGAALQLKMPEVNGKYGNNYRQTKALLAMQGVSYCDLGAAIAVERRDFAAPLSCLAIVRYRTLKEVEAWLEEHDEELQCVVSECLDHSRRVAFGSTQSPLLTDYPDARDVMAWLGLVK